MHMEDGEIVLEEHEVVDVVKVLLRSAPFYWDKVEGDYFESELCVDYRDGMQKSQLMNISRAQDKELCFYEEFDEYSMDLTMDAESELFKHIEHGWDEEAFGEYSRYEDFIDEWVKEHVCFNFPYNHYLEEDVCVNILVNAGDAEHEYTLNNFYSYNSRAGDEPEEESAMLWLVRQQGYTKEQLMDALNDGNTHGSKFLKSVVNELANVTSHMNALTFFVKMELRAFLDLMENQKSLVLSEDSRCGLYDCWMGAGSMHEIVLERPVHLPFDMMEPHIEGARGYSVDSIYGVYSSYWTESIVEMRES